MNAKITITHAPMWILGIVFVTMKHNFPSNLQNVVVQLVVLMIMKLKNVLKEPKDVLY